MKRTLSEMIIKHVAKHAEKKEILLGIDPRSTLGRDILRQNIEVMELKNEVRELKLMVAALTTTINDKL